MTRAPALGERAALRGYRWQYDHAAELVYDALVDEEFEELRLTDPTAGRVDDLVLVRGGRTEAYQFKSGGSGYLTFSEVVREGGGGDPSLVRSLADGWRNLRTSEHDTHVHLVTEQLGSVNDHLSGKEDDNRPSPDHFNAFLNRVLAPLQSGSITIGEVPAGWGAAIERLRETTGLGRDEFDAFVRALHFDVGAGSGLPPRPSRRRSDIIDLSAALQRRVSEANDTVRLDRRQVLELVGWTDRTTLRSPHDFPVDLDTYAPLTEAIDELNDALSAYNSGYLAVTGPPGSGKSTLLSQTLTGTLARVVRYYVYVPGRGPRRTRLTAHSFLHDLVLMLNQKGLDTHERQLTSGDISEARRQLFEQLEAASEEFEQGGRRTILIVDGLDHVDREYKGDDALLSELPRPDELPEGVLLIVGSRTLAPLPPEARQQVHERQAFVDLGQHQLSPASVIDICRRTQLTTDLAPELHRRIAELSGGHPLALSYLLNRLRDAEGEPAADILAAAPAYSGDVAGMYRAVWDEIEDDDAIVEILAVSSRVRVGFTTEWLSSWAPTQAVGTFQRKLLYLFRRHHDGWRFFHDSFRQFAADQTALGDDGPGNADADVRRHGRVAEVCAESADPKMVGEQLYHRYRARDLTRVLVLAQQATFREQYRQLRSPGLIRDDIALALDVAAERADVLAIIRLLLALAEVNERASALESVDMPALLYEAGLVDEAIAYCGGGETLDVPLAQAYGLAASLGEANEPAGRRLFDLIEHNGLDDPTRVRVIGQEHDAALAWTRAAVQFRPCATVLTAIQGLVEPYRDHESETQYEVNQDWSRYSQVMQVLIGESAEWGDEVALDLIESELGSFAERLHERGGGFESRTAAVMDLRVRASAAQLRMDDDAAAIETRLSELESSLLGAPLHAATGLEFTELLARYGRADRATEFLDRIPYGQALTASELSDTQPGDTLDERFRYWRLRFLLAADPVDVPESVPPAEETPYGNDVRRDAPAHHDVAAIELARRIDSAVRELARLDAATIGGGGQDTTSVWNAIVPLLDIFPKSSIRDNSSASMIGFQKPGLMQITIDVASRQGDGLPQLLSGALMRRFETQPGQWTQRLRMDLAESLQAAGASTSWNEETLRESEAQVPSEDTYSRLATMEDLASRRARAGQQDAARRLAMAIFPMAFGIGYRKDYQLNAWVDWLGSALAEPEGEDFVGEATWLARLIATVEPMTEGAPAEAANALSARVVPANATAAVRVFEYLVRRGTVAHVTALADLVGALVRHLGTADLASVELAADLTGELIAPAANVAYPDLAAALVAAADRAAGKETTTEVAKSVASRTDSYALRTARSEWRRGLGLPHTPAEPRDQGTATADDYSALVLTDGRRIAAHEVGSLTEAVDDIVKLRTTEHDESHFRWNTVVRSHSLTSDDVLRLALVFDDDPPRHADVLAMLAEAAEDHGDHETARRLATVAFDGASGDAWGQYGGGARRRAAAVNARLGGREDLVAACQDLVRQIVSNRWVPRLLLSDSQDIADALDPSLSASSVWPEIRAYLNGMVEPLDLGEPDVLTDHGCRWWLLPAGADRREPSSDPTPSAALAEIAVGHLSHPTWLIRDAATTVVVRALGAGNEKVATALARFAQPNASDDTIERAGRCLAAAKLRQGYVVREALEPLEHTLASHRSQVIRDLATEPSPRIYRALPPAYEITLPEGAESRVGSEGVFPHPHESQYEILAKGLGLDLDALLAVAANYTSEALADLPKQDAVTRAVESSDARHAHPLEELAASRAGFGRVLADLADADLLEGAPLQVQHLLRTFDVDLVGRTPNHRPDVVPAPPRAGHEQTIERWQAGLEERLDECLAASMRDDRLLIGARMHLSVLNWGHLEEELVCGTTVGTDRMSEDRLLALRRSLLLNDLAVPVGSQRPSDGSPLVVENVGLTFHQIHADWLAFRPEFAAILEWTPDSQLPGCWRTAGGDIAVETIWWVDGWWGRRGPVFDDTEAKGYAVVLTSRGLAELAAAFGETTRHFVLKRSGRDGDGVEVDTVRATRSVRVVPGRLDRIE